MESLDKSEKLILELDSNIPEFRQSYYENDSSIYLRINVLYNFSKKEFSNSEATGQNQGLMGLIQTAVNWNKEFNYLEYLGKFFSYNKSPLEEIEKTIDGNLDKFNNKLCSSFYKELSLSELKRQSLYETTLNKSKNYELQFEKRSKKELPAKHILRIPFNLNYIFEQNGF